MNKKVLIITDNSALETALSFEFESKGARVQVCGNQTAQQEALRWQPQIVIIDGALPGKESFKVCRNLKSSNQLCSIPTVMLGQAMNPRLMSEAYKAGADYYILNQGEDRRALLLTIQAVFNMQSRQMTAA